MSNLKLETAFFIACLAIATLNREESTGILYEINRRVEAEEIERI